MKRLFLLLLAAAGSSVVAQNERLEHVLISVPIHKKTAETALPVSLLTGEELRRRAAATLGETLGDKPGIANSSFGPGVGRPVIRGQQGPRAVTLQNGTASADVSGLSPDHGVAVDSLLADGIEVLRGPSTLLYGGGAIGGVVNVVDNRIPRSPVDGFEGALEYRYDDATDTDGGVFRLESGNGAFVFHLSGTAREFEKLDIPGLAIDEAALERQEELLGGEHEEEEEEHEEEELENTDGFVANADGDADTLTGGFSYHFGERGFFGFAVSSLETEYGIPPGAHGHHEEEEGEEHGEDEQEEDEHEEEEHEEEEHGEEEEIVRIDLRQTRYDAQLHWHDFPAGIDVLRAFLTYTDYAHDELEGEEVGTRYDRETWESRLEVVHDPLAGFHGVFGLQWRQDEFSARGEEAYVPETDSSEFGLFLLEDFHAGDWVFELGARADWVERDPASDTAGGEDFASFSLAGSALRDIADAWRLGLYLSRSERAPATEELFSNVDAHDEHELVTHAATGIIEIGDPGLDEEVSLNADVSLNWTGDASWVEVSLFYNDFEDYIFLFNTGTEVEETPVYAYRQDDAAFAGIEVESEFRLGRLGTGDVGLGLFGDYISAEFDDNGDVPRLPPRRVGAELKWSGESLGAWLRVLDAGDQSDPGAFETETDGYTRWDAGLDYRWSFAGGGELLTFLKWKNIGDEEIRLSTSFLRNFAPEAGESVEAGVRYSF